MHDMVWKVRPKTVTMQRYRVEQRLVETLREWIHCRTR